MAKKNYLLHRITDEDAEYIAEDTRTMSSDVSGGNCYLLVNKNSGKVFRDDGRILIYKASGIYRGETDDKKRRFLEAVEACAYFRGYANTNEIHFKTSKIADLLYKLEDHAIEIPDSCNECRIISSSSTFLNREVLNYIEQAADAYDVLHDLQRNLPTLALFLNEEPFPIRANATPRQRQNEEDFDIEEIEPEDDYDEWEDDYEEEYE